MSEFMSTINTEEINKYNVFFSIFLNNHDVASTKIYLVPTLCHA